MRTSNIIFIMSAAFALTSCLGDDEPKDHTVRDRVTVLSETQVTFPFMDTERHSPIENLVIVDRRGGRSYVGLSEIEDFDWERGYEYTLEVDKTIIANPPMDGCNVSYSLHKVVDRRKDPSFTPSGIDVNTVSDVVYAPEAPVEIYVLDWDRFSIDSKGHIEATRHNLLTQVIFDGVLSLAYTLREDSPFYCLWNYLAVKIYVGSPFDDRLRPVEPAAYGQSYPLESIMTSKELRRMADEGTAGDKFEYSLYVYGAENLALQKVNLVFERI
ncbi:MAG: DUF4377 domain-containing protein [Bacteroides sp.]|nr:DUF4377 domain-containing protein [Bacteroides sp.]